MGRDMVDDNGAGTSRTVAAWTFGLSVVSIVAAGVVVAGFLHSPEPELTTALPTTTPTTTEPEQPEFSYVTPSVTYPTQIPGCDVVEPPAHTEWVGYTSFGAPGYDNPRYPWFSGPKAGAMSQSLHAALPVGVELPFASPGQSLFFQPITSNDDMTASAESGDVDLGGDTAAYGTLLRGDTRGSLSVSVRASTDPVPACVAGQLDGRRMLADGTVVDVLDTWSETNGVRTLSRSAHAYIPDGTRVSAYSTDAGYLYGDQTNSGTVPVAVDELVSIVIAPGLRVTTPVSPGTATPPETCYPPVEEGSGSTIDRATAQRLGAVLAAVPLDGVTFDRPLGELWPTEYDDTAVCQAVRVTAPGQESTLEIAITGGQDLPASDPTPIYDGPITTYRRTPDGALVGHSEQSSTSVSMRGDSEAKYETRRVVTVTRPSGTMLRVASAADSPATPLSFEQLDAIALAPGIEVPR
ncbi:hypothetical protein M2284_001097 [Rhodococcus sp. LBL1]|nr:hypothetical protein [Rhodococcus sp. LBL1]MDH6682808.1 hypothetical protein [Rhodococcus sp. LBL2]